jgi:hypothetical protein
MLEQRALTAVAEKVSFADGQGPDQFFPLASAWCGIDRQELLIGLRVEQLQLYHP